LDDSVRENNSRLIVLGIIIGANGDTEIEKRRFSIKGDIINGEIFKGNINMGGSRANEAVLYGLSNDDIPIQRGKASKS